MSTSTVLNFGRDVQGFNAYAPQFPTDIFSATLTNGSAQSVTVPQNHSQWIMSLSIQAGCAIWVRLNGTAAIPVGNTFAASNSELNPGPRLIHALQSDGITPTTIGFITSNTSCDIEVSFYAVGTN